ncbi:MAG: hypothetical protein F6K17_34350 [Okeania sp. SIO3C4]|nr:hypothetical protein [Okeania sp. SIO3B3]NER07293.1 hypothetical protein [Okeania sp. SIO3C4]
MSTSNSDRYSEENLWFFEAFAPWNLPEQEHPKTEDNELTILFECFNISIDERVTKSFTM